MLADAHVHIGQFGDFYTNPQNAFEFLDNLGVQRFAVSSTSICEENYSKVLSEMQEIVNIGGKRVTPVLWITPNMLTNGALKDFLDCGIDWRCLKIHGYVHDWNPESKSMVSVVNFAEQLHVPLLLHTGGRTESDAGSYVGLISKHPNQTFILAHSRPHHQAMEVMQRCPNAFSDTAFTPLEHIVEMVNSGLSNRILWGTDYPLPMLFNEGKDTELYFHKLLSDLSSQLSEDDFTKITYRNYEQLF